MNQLWFHVPKPKVNPKLRLFCLSYAGGSSATYSPFADQLPNEVELVAVQLPGRGIRLSEAPYTNLSQLVVDLSKQMQPLLEVPYVVMGHSFGSRLGYELVQHFRMLQWPLPLHFIASGSKAPHYKNTDSPIHQLPEAAFIEKLRSFGGTPDEILNNADFMEMLLPMLRADFAMVETHQSEIRPALDCDLSMFGGVNDEGVPQDKLLDWQLHFSGHISETLFEGGHFFIETHKALVIKSVKEKVQALLAGQGLNAA
ncbi:alpha/beta fold hydrolase [Motilimonas cestriensis]|uniref:Alpha/beta fold hydrolase n=1 Tax=Motilimonas cestriensis TaxID=2742685 RepID=A0ABS8W889_9GAMM|nr:alpha/beta fold hydrolase [Motilimonas cestriensis]MCE2595214.1 alpha/beta fold hydrolase [Motilimonas cestriensis]